MGIDCLTDPSCEEYLWSCDWCDAKTCGGCEGRPADSPDHTPDMAEICAECFKKETP